MRLTNKMKKDLITIILNKTKNPVEVQAGRLVNLIQQKIYEVEPLLEQFISTYKHKDHLSQSIHIRLRHTSIPLYFYTPNKLYLEERICEKGLTAWSPHITNVNAKQISWYEPFKEIGEEILKVANEGFEYDDLIQSLKITIDSCNTDKELATMYPDFVQFFNSAGITQVVKKQLPAKLGLPENLEKYGLVLNSDKDKEAKQKDLEETIREDIKEEEDK